MAPKARKQRSGHKKKQPVNQPKAQAGWVREERTQVDNSSHLLVSPGSNASSKDAPVAAPSMEDGPVVQKAHTMVSQNCPEDNPAGNIPEEKVFHPSQDLHILERFPMRPMDNGPDHLQRLEPEKLARTGVGCNEGTSVPVMTPDHKPAVHCHGTGLSGCVQVEGSSDTDVVCSSAPCASVGGQACGVEAEQAGAVLQHGQRVVQYNISSALTSVHADEAIKRPQISPRTACAVSDTDLNPEVKEGGRAPEPGSAWHCEHQVEGVQGLQPSVRQLEERIASLLRDLAASESQVCTLKAAEEEYRKARRDSLNMQLDIEGLREEVQEQQRAKDLARQELMQVMRERDDLRDELTYIKSLGNMPDAVEDHVREGEGKSHGRAGVGGDTTSPGGAGVEEDAGGSTGELPVAQVHMSDNLELMSGVEARKVGGYLETRRAVVPGVLKAIAAEVGNVNLPVFEETLWEERGVLEASAALLGTVLAVLTSGPLILPVTFIWALSQAVRGRSRVVPGSFHSQKDCHKGKPVL